MKKRYSFSNHAWEIWLGKYGLQALFGFLPYLLLVCPFPHLDSLSQDALVSVDKR